MRRSLERRVLAAVTLLLAFAYGLLSLAGQAAPQSILGPMHRAGFVQWPSALLVLGGFWVAHLALCFLKPDGDPLLLPVASLLAGLGWLEVLRLHPDLAMKQAVWIVVGCLLMLLWLVVVRDYRVLQDYRSLMLAGAILLQVAVMIFGTEVNGARLWLRFGGISLQPVEIVKILLVMFLASYLRDYRELLAPGLISGRTVWLRYLAPLLVLVLICEVIFAVQKDLGMGLLVFGAFMGVFFMATGRWDLATSGLVLFAGMSYVCYQLFGHVRVRFAAWLDPWADPNGSSFQIVQALYAVASGGITGAGYGLGQPWWIPEVHTDFIFVALTEELGMIGAAACLVAYAILAQRAFRIGVQAIERGEEFGGILSWGLGATLACQTFIVVAGTLKMTPMTGITLPFASYGGSSLMANFLILGMLLQVSQSAHRAPPAPLTRSRTRLLATATFASRVFLWLLVLPVVYLTWFQLTSAPVLALQPSNPRNHEDLALRGSILDRRGNNLAVSRNIPSEGFQRVYPTGEVCATSTGYWNEVYGESGLELAEDLNLKGQGVPHSPLDALQNLLGKPLRGEDIILTLDRDLQQVAYDALGDRRGAVVVLDPHSGEILASVSRPSYDPNKLESQWPRLRNDPASSLLNRTVDGRYPPGSVFKLITLAAALQYGVIQPTDTFYCPGYIDVGGYRLHCDNGEAHGTVTVAEALTHSCNVTFAQIALKLGTDRMMAAMHDWLPEVAMRRPESDNQLAQMGFGQGELALSPLQVARVTACIASGGHMLRPHLIKGRRERGSAQPESPPDQMGRPVTEDVARTVTSMMESVVQSGTGRSAAIAGVRVAGKTGTAENPHGPSHAWFAGFGPAEDPRFVVVTLVENAGYGGDVAAPVFRRVLQKALGR